MKEHSHSMHSTKCLREAAHKIGFELHDVYHWMYRAVRWLTQRGEVSIEGNDEAGWTVKVETPVEKIWDYPYPDVLVVSGGHSLSEAICGAVHAIDVPETVEV